MVCSQKFLHLQKIDANEQSQLVVRMACGRWDCPDCRSKKSKKIQSFIKSRFKRKSMYMLTFTFFQSKSVIETWAGVGKAWNRFASYVRGSTGKFDYIRILEPHKKGGYPHMHVLTSTFVAKKKAVELITKHGFGWNFSSKKISLENAARYVSKYLSKEWFNAEYYHFREVAKTRLVQGSRGLGAIFKKTSSGWTLVEILDENTKSGRIKEIYLEALAAKHTILHLDSLGDFFELISLAPEEHARTDLPIDILPLAVNLADDGSRVQQICLEF